MQTHIDSVMEVVTNTIIGLVISTLANHFVLPAVLGVQMTSGENLLIAVIFTVISLVRSYILRRAFNGRSVWQSIRQWWTLPMEQSPLKVRAKGLYLFLILPALIPYGILSVLRDEDFFGDVADAYRLTFTAMRTGKVPN